MLDNCFYDWLACYQEHSSPIPIVASGGRVDIDFVTGSSGTVLQNPIEAEGSYSTKITVFISGNRIKISGNPSRYNRLDNLFGLTSLDECFDVYNRILRSIGLGDFQFTKCTQVFHRNGACGDRVEKSSDGAVITRLDITTNRSTGVDHSQAYLRALSTQPYRNSIPQLYSNGMTADWLSKKGKASMIYASAYVKAHEITINALASAARKFGTTSAEYLYVLSVRDYCRSHGVVRFEQKIKSAYLRRKKLNYYGLFDESVFNELQNEFLKIDDKLVVEAMTIENISEKLLRLGVVDTTRAANTTAFYAHQWSCSQVFDFKKSQVKTHRARLRKIGIDIALPCDLSKHSSVLVVKSEQVHVSTLEKPSWYQEANNPVTRLSLVA
jgi:hypothetical protein